MILFLLPNLLSSVITIFLWAAPPFLQVIERTKCIVPSLLVHGTNSWPFYYLSCAWHLLSLVMNSWRVEFTVLKSQSMRLILFVCKEVCNILHMCCYHCCCDYWMFWWKQESKIISPFWSAALVSLVHRNPLCEHCSLVDQGALEGNAPSAIKWSTALGVEFWAQHPPHTQTQPVFSPSVD